MQEATHTVSDREKLARLRSALAAMGDVVYQWDLITDFVTWSGDASNSLGVTAAGVPSTGSELGALVIPEDVAARSNYLTRLHSGEKQFECEYRLNLPQQGECWVHDRASTEFGADGKPVRLVGILRFMDPDIFRAGRRGHLANFDQLTGHFNRDRLREALDHALNVTKRYKVEGAYLVVGVDKLMMINQALGHGAADSVLLAVGDRLDRCLRASDVIGRVGGDKFEAVLSNVPESKLEAATGKILDALRQAPINKPEGPVYVTVSIGAVTFPGAINTAQDVMMRSDAALQKAKQSGRDCAVTYIFSEEQKTHHKACIVIAERMIVEITETAGLEDLEACCRFVSTLRDLGCEVALDDFGAGYTSFRQLKKLAVNKVKINGAFVRNLGENPDNLVFIRTLIRPARTFNLETVAECVETEAEAELLLNEGVHYMQGYALGKPDLGVPWSRIGEAPQASFGGADYKPSENKQDSDETSLIPMSLPMPAIG